MGGGELEIVNKGNMFKSFIVKVSKKETKGRGQFMIKGFLLYLSSLVDYIFIYGNYKAFLN